MHRGSGAAWLSERRQGRWLDWIRRLQYPSIVARRSSNTRTLRFIGLVLIVAGAASLSIRMRGRDFTSVSGADSVTVPTDTLGRGQVRFYSYRNRSGEKLRFFLGRDSGGEVHAAIDACQRCYTYHKGYVSSHGYLVCKLCGNRYKLDAMTSGIASCAPVKLSMKMAGQAVRVSTAELERNSGLF